MAQRITGQSRYAAIAEALERGIEDGTYPPGSQLPTHSALMKQHGAALGTVTQALNILRDKGRVAAHQGIGTFVLPPEQWKPEAPGVAKVAAAVDEMRGEIAELRGRVDRLGKIEASLMDLYGKLGYEYPRESADARPAQTPPRRRRAAGA
jgi:DNA-binding GntR family transcriptional regulator